LETQLVQDLMFRRFINLSLSEGVPDHSTLWRSCNTITQQGLLDILLAEVNQQLSAKGLYQDRQRNQARFRLAAMAYNIKRGVAVQAEMLTFAVIPSNALKTADRAEIL
jgi:IS5 family transposase